jgi:DNA processing protein
MTQLADTLATEALNCSNCIKLALLIDEGGMTGRVLRQAALKIGGFKKLLDLSGKTLMELIGGPPERITKIATLLRSGKINEKVYRITEQCDREKIQTIVCTDLHYPERLKRISSYPTVLFWRGVELTHILAEPFLATVVGTRRPTGYGRIMTDRITGPLAEAGIVIVSGLARGIDTLAHKAALAAGCPTIGVLACGVDIAYPPENVGLIDRIIERGIVMSEHVPGTPPIPTYFPARNRILSGLSDAVIIIEASIKSGSMITASFAADQGRDVYAVPGNVLSLESAGCNNLIREGAFLLTTAEDVLWRIPAGRRLDAFAAAIHRDNPDEADDDICLILAGGPLTIDELSMILERPMPDLLCLLTDLELKGLVHRERGRFALTG